MKKITYIELDRGLTKSLSNLHKIARKEDVIKVLTVASDFDEAKAINEAIASIKDIKDTLICIVPPNAELKENFIDFISPYVKETDNKVYMPMVELVDVVEDKTNFKGFINATLWKSYMVAEVGVLNYETAKKQIDMSLYFALIDGALLSIVPFKESIPFFYQYEWLNTVTATEAGDVLGIPKVVGYFPESKEYQATTQEQKVEWFKTAQVDIELQNMFVEVEDNG